jgi:hypothetical protein
VCLCSEGGSKASVAFWNRADPARRMIDRIAAIARWQILRTFCSATEIIRYPGASNIESPRAKVFCEPFRSLCRLTNQTRGHGWS